MCGGSRTNSLDKLIKQITRRHLRRLTDSSGGRRWLNSEMAWYGLVRAVRGLAVTNRGPFLRNIWV